MKILILSFYYHPDLCAGSFRCTALVEQLKKVVGADCDIDVITTMPNRYASFHVNALELEQHPGITIKRLVLPSHEGGMVKQAKAFWYFAKQVCKLTQSSDYDLIFATSSRLMTAVLGAWVAQYNNAKLYLDIRDVFVETIGDIFPLRISFFIKPIFSGLEKWVLKRADRINVVSKGFCTYFSKRYPHSDFCCYTNGVDAEFILLDGFNKQSARNSSKILTVLYAGNIGAGQGLDHIIPQLAKSMEGRLHFRVIGDGGRKHALSIAVKEMGCENVELLPPVSRSVLIEEYQRADILFLHLNDYDAFKKVLPSKIFEYAATGKPIWAGVSGYPAEFMMNEIRNIAIFESCNAIQAEKVFNNLKLNVIERTAFIDKFSRSSIMNRMAVDMLSLIKG